MVYDGPRIQIPGGGNRATAAASVTEGPSSFVPRLDEDTMWKMTLTATESVDAEAYPERPGEPDCTYYMRTGLCRFGVTCRYNHPSNRNLVVAAARLKGGYPERLGQPECQYYLKTGTCKFGATCKFHHPRDKAGVAGRVQLNDLGYPLRPNQVECAYYLRTGLCKFGNTCKFHHPKPINAVVSSHGSTIHPTVHSPTTTQQSYPSGLTNWSISRTPFIPSPRWQGPSGYTQLILPQGLVQFPGWNAYPGQMGSASSRENQQHVPGTSQFYGSSSQIDTSGVASQGTFSSYRASSIPIGMYALPRENVFPERPGEPECQFYMKTGDCKFGSVCRFHHPRERFIPVPNCLLSPMGLPLRPGEPLCIFYSRYGICKFGPNCKFDHPVGNFPYGFSASVSMDVPVRHLLGSSSGSAGFSLSPKGSVDTEAGRSRRLSQTQPPRQIASQDDNIEADAAC